MLRATPTALALVALLSPSLGACVELDDSQIEAEDPFADALVDFVPAAGASFGHDALPDVVLGAPGGLFDVVSLGCEGSITLEFDAPGIPNGPGADLIVFENPFSSDFPEPGEVAVSEDGETWLVFPCEPTTLEGCAGVTPTLALPGAGLDPTQPGEAGGDAFDLSQLPEAPARVRFVRIVDRSRDYWEALGDMSFCDPASQGSGGFDLDAIAAVHDAPADAASRWPTRRALAMIPR